VRTVVGNDRHGGATHVASTNAADIADQLKMKTRSGAI